LTLRIRLGGKSGSRSADEGKGSWDAATPEGGARQQMLRWFGAFIKDKRLFSFGPPGQMLLRLGPHPLVSGTELS